MPETTPDPERTARRGEDEVEAHLMVRRSDEESTDDEARAARRNEDEGPDVEGHRFR